MEADGASDGHRFGDPERARLRPWLLRRATASETSTRFAVISSGVQPNCSMLEPRMRLVNAVIWFSCHARRLLVVLVATASLAAAWGLTQLRLNDNLADLFKADNEEYLFLERFLEEFGADDRDCVVLLRSEDFFTPESVRALRRVVKRLDEMPEVESVHSILDAYRFVPGLSRKVPVPLVPRANLTSPSLEKARARAHQHPIVAGHLLSDDGRAMLIPLRLAADCRSAQDTRRVTARVHDVLTRELSQESMVFTLTGVAQLRADIYLCIRHEQVKFILIGVAVAVSLAAYLFRSLSAVVIACAPPLAGALWTVGGMGLFGEPVNTLNSIVPALVLVVGFTDAVHLLLEIRRERVAGSTPYEAVATALRRLMLPCFLTSTTTAVGFASLAVAQLEVVQRFGFVCAAGALINFAAVVPLVPYLSTTWLGKSLGTRASDEDRQRRFEQPLTHLVHALVGKSRGVVIAGVALTLIGLSLAWRLKPDNHLRAGIPDGTASYEALRYCDEAFGGVMYSYVVVRWPPEYHLNSPEVLLALHDVHRILAEQEPFGPPFSVLNLLHSLPHRSGELETAVRYLDSVPTKTLDKLVREAERRAVVMFQTPDRGARALEPDFARVEGRLETVAAEHPGFQLRLTGSTVVSARNVNLIIEDLVSSLGLASLTILATLTIAFRSFRLGLLTLIPNVLPLVTAAAVLWFRGDGLEVQAAVTFSICLGVAVDDTIHVLNRFVLALKGGNDTYSAVESATVRAGYALTITTLTMLGGFGAGLFSALPALRVFSFLACVTFVVALAASLVLLPALLICFCRETGAFPLRHPVVRRMIAGSSSVK